MPLKASVSSRRLFAPKGLPRIAPDLGVIGDGRGRGFHLHSSLALRVEGWTAEQRPEVIVVGLVGQQCICPEPAPEGEKRSERPYRKRQSERWASELHAMGKPPAACRWIYIADRESDIYEPIQQFKRQEWDFIIRSSQDRRLGGERRHLREAIAKAPVQGVINVELRARPGQAARTATVEVRSQTMSLAGPWRPGGRQADFTVNVIDVREVNAPPDVDKPLHWILLTSLPCGTWIEVQRVVGR